MKVDIDINKKTVLFICSPSLGILDSWISVLTLLRKKLPNAKFIFIAPKSSIISSINLDTVLFRLANDIFDHIAFRSDSGIWLFTNTFLDAKKINSSSEFNLFHLLIGLLRKLNLKSLAKIVARPYKFLTAILYSKFLFKISIIKKTNYFTLFDVTQFDKSYNEDLNFIIADRYNFSIIHGVNPRPTSHIKLRLSKGKNISSNKKHLTKNSIVFALSEKEREFYQLVYGLKNDQIKVFGIPRHEKNWIKSLIDQEESENSQDKYILVISRPVSNILPAARKKKFLEMIKTVAKQLRYKVIIKLHPKEKYYEYYEDVFEKKEYKKSWEISTKHPFILGKNCEFAVSFYSGVPIDLIVFGVPTIELLDLKNIKGYDNEYALRDNNGEPVLNVRYLNLVLGTSSFKGFQEHVENILNDRDGVIDRLKEEYKKNFPVLEKVNDKIANYIFENID